MTKEFKKETAVEWFKTQILNFPNPENAMMNIEKLLLETLEKEKEQILDAYGDGLNSHRTNFCNRDEYFDKVYGVRS